MTAPEHVQCYIVNNVLQQLTTLGTATPGPSPYRPDAENRKNLSGVILRVADVTSAAIAFHQDPDSTQSLVLSEPVFASDATKEINATWFRQLLSAAVNYAQQNGFTQIRFLDWESKNDAMLWIAQELELAEFSALASVVGWKTTAEKCLQRGCAANTARLSTADLHGLTKGRQPGLKLPIGLVATEFQAQPRFREIAAALDQILENTDDLTNLDAPNGNDLLQKWSTQDCTLVVAETEFGVVGVCAFAFKPSSDCATAASGQIEYLGVRKELQRIGIATQMLAYLCRGVSRGSEQTVVITAFADETNFPANSFYRRNGFEPLCRGKLWYHTINNHRKHKEPS